MNILEYLQCLVLNLKITLKLNTMKNIYYLCVFLFISNTQFIFSQVGINTTSPQETLHVEGTLRVTNTNNTTVTTKIAGTCAQGTVSDILVGENLILKSNVLSANSGNYGIVDISIPVIAVNQVFDNQADYSGSSLFIAAIFFAFQIYGDFSGYSDIAIGTSRLFGFDLKQNFAFPYFSRDIAEFWRRWHISLSTWFRDYVYIPLGGSRGSKWNQVRNVFVIFLVSGFWHGANWTFIVWGALNALYFLPLLLFKKNRLNTDTVAQGKNLPSLKELFQMSITFGLTINTVNLLKDQDVVHCTLVCYGQLIGV